MPGLLSKPRHDDIPIDITLIAALARVCLVPRPPLFRRPPGSRSFQTHASTVKFESYKKGPDEEEFADFKVGFRHPVHGEEIFNVSDPMHDMKKLVNALWHSDLPDKPRQLGNFCVDNADGGNLKFVPFSLKTGERVYRGEEFDNDSLTAAERASVWTIHQNISQGVWKRDSYNCMSVSHAAKVGHEGCSTGVHSSQQ